MKINVCVREQLDDVSDIENKGMN